MKKTILLTLLLLGIVKAEDNVFSLNKTTIDIAKDEILMISYESGQGTHRSANYRLYTNYDISSSDGYDGKIYLDISPIYGPYYLDYPIQYSIPISLAILDDLVQIQDSQITRELVVSFASEDGSEKYESETFEITIINSAYSESGGSGITDPSGAWFQQGLSGTWFSITQYSNGSGVLYTGHKDGQPLWLMSNIASDAWVKGVPKTFEMYVAGNDDSLVSWGSLQLQFNSCNAGLATLTGSNSTQTFELTKLALPVNANCVEK